MPILRPTPPIEGKGKLATIARALQGFLGKEPDILMGGGLGMAKVLKFPKGGRPQDSISTLQRVLSGKPASEISSIGDARAKGKAVNLFNKSTKRAESTFAQIQKEVDKSFNLQKREIIQGLKDKSDEVIKLVQEDLRVMDLFHKKGIQMPEEAHAKLLEHQRWMADIRTQAKELGVDLFTNPFKKK